MNNDSKSCLKHHDQIKEQKYLSFSILVNDQYIYSV